MTETFGGTFGLRSSGDVGSKPGHTFDPHSADNYVTKAQASAVIEVAPAGGDGPTQYLWMGNQVTAPCASAASVAKTAPLPCVSAAIMGRRQCRCLAFPLPSWGEDSAVALRFRCHRGLSQCFPLPGGVFQWNSGLSQTPPGGRMHDLLYWTVLQFNANGTVKQVPYETEITLQM